MRRYQREGVACANLVKRRASHDHWRVIPWVKEDIMRRTTTLDLMQCARDVVWRLHNASVQPDTVHKSHKLLSV